MFPRISSRLGQGVIALQLPSNLREAVRKYHDPPCRRRVQLAKLGSDYMNRSGYAIVALPASSLLHEFRTWVAVCRCQGTKALPN